VKILLLNDNPVVNKLVTLSAQKTSDTLDIVSSVDDIEAGEYDLIVVDDSLYNEDLMNILADKVKSKKSLFICARDKESSDEFSSVLKKPFLPTDLVELFMMFDKEIANEVEEVSTQSDESMQSDEAFDVDELNLDDDDLGESVLDDEEAQKVKDLLDENDLELSFDDEVSSDLEELALDEEELVTDEELALDEEESDEEELAEDDDLLAEYDLALDLEDEADVDTSETLVEELESPEEILDEVEDIEEEIPEEILDEVEEIEEVPEDEEELKIPEEILDEVEEIEESPEEPQNLESEIQDAVENLSQEDLQSEVDEDTLLQIATNEIDPLSDLTSKDFKVALGEEVEEEPEEVLELEDVPVDEVPDNIEEIADIDTPAVAELEDNIPDEDINEEENKGVEALKKLLEALNNKDVAASMKGMKISINITLGEN